MSKAERCDSPDEKKAAYFAALRGLNESVGNLAEALGMTGTPHVIGMSEEVLDANLAAGDQGKANVPSRRSIRFWKRLIGRKPSFRKQHPTKGF